MKINPIPKLSREEIIRFLDKVEVGDSNDCWQWTGARTNFGHGRVRIQGKLFPSHRISYSLFKEPIPEGLVVDHFICSNPVCVNPRHLKAVTHEQNSLRSNVAYCAVKAKVTHCPKGHPLSGDNLWVRKKKGRKPSRECLTCHRERKRIANRTDEQNNRTRELNRESRRKRFATREAKDKKNAKERERIKRKKLERENIII